MADSLSGDPFHEGTSKPQMGLQGSCTGVNTQMPMDSDAMTNPRSAAPDNVGQTWNSSSLAPTPAATGSNDKAEAH